MFDHTLAVTLAIAVCGSSCTAANGPNCAVIGYLPEYQIEQVEPEQCQTLTCLIYFGLIPQANGRIATSPIKEPVLNKLKRIQRRSGCRVLISVGGWKRSNGFPALAANQAARQRFIRDIRLLCRQHGFDGIDYDWEHPKGAFEIASYVRLLAETKAAFRVDGLLVTVAQAGWQDLGRETYDCIDRIHLMAYDHPYPHSTIDKAREDVERLIKNGCPPEKIALGLPLYGRNQAGMARSYSELIGTRQVNPSTDNLDGYAFNGRNTITAKVDYAFRRDLAGLMIWEIGQDSRRPTMSLLTTIDRRLKLRSSTTE